MVRGRGAQVLDRIGPASICLEKRQRQLAKAKKVVQQCPAGLGIGELGALERAC